MVFDSTLEIVLYIIEIIGCISFATSGAFAAIRKKADILGVWILTIIAIFGGGLLRDIIINNGAPHCFWDVQYLVLMGISVVISTVWFIIASVKKTAPFIEKHRHDFWIYGLDAIGIAVFCCSGLQTAYDNLPSDITVVGKYFYIISLGVITGVGGGMFRDIFIGEIPMVFRKHFYMSACIIGTVIYAFMYKNCNDILSVVVTVLVITVLRLLATIFKWNLPRAKAYNYIIEQKEQEKVMSLNTSSETTTEVKVEEKKDFRKRRKGTDFKKEEPNKTSINICDNHEDGA